MSLPHIELYGNTALAAEKVDQHTYITALEIQIFEPGPLRSTNVAKQSNQLEFGKQISLLGVA